MEKTKTDFVTWPAGTWPFSDETFTTSSQKVDFSLAPTLRFLVKRPSADGPFKCGCIMADCRLSGQRVVCYVDHVRLSFLTGGRREIGARTDRMEREWPPDENRPTTVSSDSETS